MLQTSWDVKLNQRARSLWAFNHLMFDWMLASGSLGWFRTCNPAAALFVLASPHSARSKCWARGAASLPLWRTDAAEARPTRVGTRSEGTQWHVAGRIVMATRWRSTAGRPTASQRVCSPSNSLPPRRLWRAFQPIFAPVCVLRLHFPAAATDSRTICLSVWTFTVTSLQRFNVAIS